MSSMSKTMKNTVIKKKETENGNRLNFIGLKPHSNGLEFCQLDS